MMSITLIGNFRTVDQLVPYSPRGDAAKPIEHNGDVDSRQGRTETSRTTLFPRNHVPAETSWPPTITFSALRSVSSSVIDVPRSGRSVILLAEKIHKHHHLVMRIIDTTTHANPFGEAVRLFLAACQDRANQPATVVGLCGGRSIVGFLDALTCLLSNSREVIPPNVHFFMVDERCVPIDHPESNYRLLREHFFERAMSENRVEPSQIHPFEIGSDPKAATLVYTEKLAGLDQEGFSIVVLGLGEDGHVAALFPRHPSLDVAERRFLTIDDSPKPPPQRMTASLPLVCTAQYGFLLAIEECPGRVIHSLSQSWAITDLVATS
jgi:6-phosphogluconolactonase